MSCGLQLESMLLSFSVIVKVLGRICDWILNVLFIWPLSSLHNMGKSLVGDKFDEVRVLRGQSHVTKKL